MDHAILAVFPLTGTLINVVTVIVGTAVGVSLEHRLPERMRETVMSALGIITLSVGFNSALEMFRPPLSTLTPASVLMIMGSVLLGAIAGEILRIEDGLAALGDRLKRRFGDDQARFTEGFVVASLVFCVGPLTILGSIQDGLTGDYQLLAIKALLDGFAALAFASALGVGVGFSVITVLIYQGGLSLAASSVSGLFSDDIIAAMTAAGGVLIIGIGFRLLDLKQVRVGNMLPALVLAPVAIALFKALR